MKYLNLILITLIFPFSTFALGPITGNPVFCLGTSTVFIESTPGGIWTSSNTTVTSVGSSTGNVTGLSAGTSTISYTVGSLSATKVVTVYPQPAPVAYTVILPGGSSHYCFGGAGVNIQLNNSDTGISYQLFRDATSHGSPLSGTGSVLNFGMQTLAGNYAVTGTNGVGCISPMTGTSLVTIDPLPSAHSVTGGGSYCAGGSGMPVGIASSDAGISYQLYDGVVTVGGPVSGTGTSISFGSMTTGSTYTVQAANPVTSCSSTMYGSATVVITPTVTPSVSLSLTPDDTVCPGTVVTFSPSPVSGGSSPVYEWKVNGIVMSTGSTYTYIPSNADLVQVAMTSSASCPVPATVTNSVLMTVNFMPPVSGGNSVCIGGTLSLTDAVTGGTWSSSDPSVATIATVGGSVGVASGIAAGTSVITYLLGTGCYATSALTVLPLPYVSAGYSAACGNSYTLHAVGGSVYSWSPATGLSCTTCDTTITSPSATTTFTVTGTDLSGCSNIDTITINGNRIFGHISFSSYTPDTLDMKVWLIQYDPSDSSITALDSTTTCTVDSIGYYEFNGKPAGNYLVKAQLIYGNTPGSGGYLPTYGLSTPHWYSAASVAHTVASDSMHIDMMYGTVPPGPGFIGGYVYSGAGKGTDGDGPVSGMLVYLKDLSNNILTYTYTDAFGAYSFDNLGYGDYVVHPEQYHYHTICSDFITLSAESKSARSVVFREYTTSRIISPYTVIVAETHSVPARSGLNIYPNPSTGMLNIQWLNQATGTADIIVSDVIGRKLFNSSLDINAPSGTSAIDLTGLNAGMYFITVKSDEINYSSKLVLRH